MGSLWLGQKVGTFLAEGAEIFLCQGCYRPERLQITVIALQKTMPVQHIIGVKRGKVGKSATGLGIAEWHMHRHQTSRAAAKALDRQRVTLTDLLHHCYAIGLVRRIAQWAVQRARRIADKLLDEFVGAGVVKRVRHVAEK